MIDTIEKLDHVLEQQESLAGTAVRLLDEVRGAPDSKPGELPPEIEELLFEDPPPLDGDFDPRVAELYERLWDYRDDVLVRLYGPGRIYIGRALYRLVLELPGQARVDMASLLEAAKSRFFLHVRSKWDRIRVDEVPTGRGNFQTVVKSTDALMTGVVREMRASGLLADIETPAP